MFNKRCLAISFGITLIAVSGCSKPTATSENSDSPPMMTAESGEAQHATESTPNLQSNAEIKADDKSNDNADDKLKDNAELTDGVDQNAKTNLSNHCENWSSNPIFDDGHIFIYNAKLEQEACCDLDKSDPSWECDDDGDCTREISFKIQCTSKLTHTESNFCASTISCTTNSGYQSELYDFLPMGKWYIDTNGIYRLSGTGMDTLVQQSTPGNCKRTKYIKCVPDTLAYIYTNFQNQVPLFPLSKTRGVNEDDCDNEDNCSTLSIKYKNHVWTRTESVDGADSSAMTIVLDETRGLIKFETMFSGGSERTFTATME